MSSVTSAPPTLRIAPVRDPLPECTPNLMPFHIAYSGPAPVSTYFRVKPAPPPTFGKDDTDATPEETTQNADDARLPSGAGSGSSQSTLVASSSSVTLDSAAAASAAADTQTDETASSAERFVAAFRGRTVQGLAVGLPKGYAGLVLQTPDAKRDQARKDVQANDKKAVKRTTRRSARAVDMDTSDAVPEDAEPAEDEDLPARVLKPTSTFSSFVIWHQDTVVDEGSDEYLRSLNEWTRLAAEIHHFESEG